MFKKLFKILLIVCISFIGIFLLFFIFVYVSVKLYKPKPPVDSVSKYSIMLPREVEGGMSILGKNWIKLNRYGLWEMYIEGDAFDRGVAAGKLSKNLIKYQEEIFVSQIDKIIHSKLYQQFLLTFVAWFNRNLPEQIKPEYLKEIYGISLSASHKYDEYGPSYLRLLNYHAAHDIGHAMQGYYLVGCSSFSTWDKYSKDFSLIIGRNFDFYFGDNFPRNKIIEFVHPDLGYNFAFITWGGMIGVVSGMNDQGLTVTINAGTASFVCHTATPVSLVAREILQYASNINEAIAIVSKKELFVSESFLIGSAADKKSIIIEKKPDCEDIVWPDSSVIISTNHFQGNEFVKSESNVDNKVNNATGYRFLRVVQLINQNNPIDPIKAASILRDTKGLNDKAIGYGNEKALNQLIAHHSVIFEPEKRIMWVSTSPNVIGPYMAYDLKKVFSVNKPPEANRTIDEMDLEIPADAFIQSDDYRKYLEFKVLTIKIKDCIENKFPIADSVTDKYLSLNPEYFKTYLNLGDYYLTNGNYQKACDYYETGLSKEPDNQSVFKYMNSKLDLCKKHLQP
jgi:predicted choloylglycine hydrolase